MIVLEARHGQQVIRATGKTRAEAEARLIKSIERRTGMRLVRNSKDGAEFQRFDEPRPLPEGKYDRCYIDPQGRIVCPAACSCADCKSHQFSERKKNMGYKRVRAFDDGSGDSSLDPIPVGDLKKAIAEHGADMGILDNLAPVQLAEILHCLDVARDDSRGTATANDDTAGDDANDPEVAAAAAHHEKFSERYDRAGTDKATLLAGFRAARKVNPGLTFAEFSAP
jgi:hypothetical protein